MQHRVNLCLDAFAGERWYFFLDRAFADLILELANNAWHGAEDLGQGKIQQTWIFFISDGQGVVRTKAVRRIGEEWDAALVLGVEIMPSQVFVAATNKAQAESDST